MPINLKLAFRSLSRSPFVSVIAIASLALGIGANVAIFSLFHQMLLRPLPVEDPGTLVNLSSPGVKTGSVSSNMSGNSDNVFSYPMFRDLEAAQTVFTGIAGYRSFAANLGYDGETSAATGMFVSGAYFEVLGLAAPIGRLIGRNDDAVIGESAVVVLSHSYWQTRFGGDGSVLGDTLVVNGRPLAIIGVAPEEFTGTTLGATASVFVPITLREVLRPQIGDNFDNRNAYWVYLFARLNPGIDLAGARAAMQGQYSAILNEVEAPLQGGMSDERLAQFRAKEIGLAPGARGQSNLQSDDTALGFTMLNAVTGLVLLIACANIASLLLSRAVARAGEMAVRLSVGASRRHLLSQLLTESMVLAVLGGFAGLLVARWTISSIISLLPDQATEALSTTLNGPVLLFAAAAALGSGFVFGLFPALLSTRPDVLSALKGDAGQPSGARSAVRFRTVLTTAQIAVAMALLVSAGLFVRSLASVSRVELGLDVDNMITFAVSPERNGYEPPASRALFERTENALMGLPGITSVSAARIPVLARSNSTSNVRVQGFEIGPDTDANASWNQVGPDFFRTLGITLLAGREFNRSDVTDSPGVAIVNEAFARKFGLDRDAVGKRMAIGGGDELDLEIVGLVQDAKYSEVKDEVPPQFFMPYRQSNTIGSLTFYARSEIDAREQLSAIAPLVSRLDPNLPVETLRTMQMQVENNTIADRAIGILTTIFAGLATVLAIIGLYGVLAYTVVQRTREIGVRVALGAGPSRVRGMVLRQTAVMTAIGTLIGLAAALALGRAVEAILFEVSGTDPLVFVSATVLLVSVALGAGAVPAHRASRVDPMRALRGD